MKKMMTLLPMIFLLSCAHGPRCGSPEGAKIVLMDSNGCQIRIRQVTVGSELKIPASLKSSGLAQFQLEWIDGRLNNGQIELGHFVLIPAIEPGIRP